MAIDRSSQMAESTFQGLSMIQIVDTKANMKTRKIIFIFQSFNAATAFDVQLPDIAALKTRKLCSVMH